MRKLTEEISELVLGNPHVDERELAELAVQLRSVWVPVLLRLPQGVVRALDALAGDARGRGAQRRGLWTRADHVRAAIVRYLAGCAADIDDGEQLVLPGVLGVSHD